ncbi:MAG: solute:sodium symporter family transporter [Planctomycetaceae bacterium]
MQALTLGSFVFFTALVGFVTWLLTRGDKHDTSTGYFLGGRSLTGGFIAGSLLLTNLSTEQLIGLNSDAFNDGLCVMAWEVIAGLSLVVMALFFLPRYLKSGIATIPEFLEKRFDDHTRTITSIIFLVAYTLILLPMILYTGATGLNDILDMRKLTGFPSDTSLLWFSVWLIGIIGSIYAIFGGLRTVAVSDTLNGFGLLSGGLLIAWLGLQAVNPDPVVALEELRSAHSEKFNSLGSPSSTVPFSTLFTGVLLLNLFYWCTNQQIIQRAFAATNLKEGQKGVLLAGVFKLLAPLILVLPGIIAFALYGFIQVQGERLPIQEISRSPVTLIGRGDDGLDLFLQGDEATRALATKSLDAARKQIGQTVQVDSKTIRVENVVGNNVVIAGDQASGYQYVDITDDEYQQLVSPRKPVRAYGVLVRRVLPPWLSGFFAAVMVGAILSSFNSVLNSSATLFSLGVYQHLLKPNATEAEVIRSGKTFGWVVAVFAMCAAPMLAGQESIFSYLQKMNGLYFIPIFSVVLVGMLTRRVPAIAANVALIAGVAAISMGYFVPAVERLISGIHGFHFLGIVFVSLIALMLIIGAIRPRETAWVQEDVHAVDLTPWRFAKPVGLVLVVVVMSIYLSLADWSVVGNNVDPVSAALLD